MCYCDCVIHPVESGPFFILHRAIPVTSVMGYAHKKGNLLHCVIPVTSVVGYARKKGISRTWIFNSWKSGQILKSAHPRAMQGIVRGCVCETGGSASGHTEETLIPDGRQERRHKTGFSYEIPDCVKITQKVFYLCHICIVFSCPSPAPFIVPWSKEKPGADILLIPQSEYLIESPGRISLLACVAAVHAIEEGQDVLDRRERVRSPTGR